MSFRLYPRVTLTRPQGWQLKKECSMMTIKKIRFSGQAREWQKINPRGTEMENQRVFDVLATFVRTKVAQKALGCSPSGQTAQRHRAAAYLQATYAPDKSRIKQIFASHLAVCLFRLSRNPKPDESLNCHPLSNISLLSFSFFYFMSFSGLTRESILTLISLDPRVTLTRPQGWHLVVILGLDPRAKQKKDALFA